VDYLQLISAPEKEGRYAEVSEISRRIKVAARDYNVGILALCQVSRDVDRRDTVQWNLSDMKESGSIEQDADLILAGFWHGRSDKGGAEDAYELHCLKRRNGPVRMEKMHFIFDAEKQIFKDG
jgi:replicative DNA helicase